MSSLTLIDEFHESGSGHLETSHKVWITLAGSKVLLTEESSRKNFVNGQHVESKEEYSIEVSDLVEFIKRHGSLLS